MYYNNYSDDDLLREVDSETRRENYLRRMLEEASERRDVENVESILSRILARIGRVAADLRALAYKAIEWFGNRY